MKPTPDTSLNSKTNDSCDLCRVPVGPAVSELVGGAWNKCVCLACARRQLIADGGAVLELSHEIEQAGLELGEIHIRPGAVLILDRTQRHYWEFLVRHAQGDRGLFDSQSAGAESLPATAKQPFLAGTANVISGYALTTRDRLWIMTTPKVVTVILAPGEF